MSSQPSTLQDFPYDAGLQAVKDSVQFQTFDEFYVHLVDGLPQNSPETRKRYASLIVRWFLPTRTLDGLLPTVWREYRDEGILHEIMRVGTLEAEPVIARFVTEYVLPILPGDPFPVSQARDYVTSTYGQFKEQSYKRLLTTARRLGFLARVEGAWAVAGIVPPKNGLMILLHARLAPTPRIVRVSDLLATSWWRYLGFRTPEEVRHVLWDATDAGLLARYAVVDELEQVTTRYSCEEYLARRCRLA